mmetsp:Transcript_7829/g.16989  ORF Transcript_7829/g.16989 Transcript_7829/m.16989 type:complete len:137 (+) Transcript_7829:303-713(+)
MIRFSIFTKRSHSHQFLHIPQENCTLPSRLLPLSHFTSLTSHISFFFHHGITFALPSFCTAKKSPVVSIVMESSSARTPRHDTSTGVAPNLSNFSFPGPNSVATMPGAMTRTATPLFARSQLRLLAIMLAAALLVR